MKGDSDIMKKQVFCIDSIMKGVFKIEKINPIMECPITDAFRNKPVGGIWTSALDGNTCGWLDWCRYNWEGHGGNIAVILTPKKDVKVYQIKDLETLQAASTRPADSDGFFGESRSMIDFRRLNDEGYDGVNVTAEAAVAFHFATDLRGFVDLNTWDCESTVWFHGDWIQSYETKRVVNDTIVL